MIEIVILDETVGLTRGKKQELHFLTSECESIRTAPASGSDAVKSLKLVLFFQTNIIINKVSCCTEHSLSSQIWSLCQYFRKISL